MKFRRAPIRYACSLLLIVAGTCGVLFSPSVGLFGGTETRYYRQKQVQQHSWGVSIGNSEIGIPVVQDERGFFFMNLFLAASLGALFGGVHWFAALRNQPTAAATLVERTRDL